MTVRRPLDKRRIPSIAQPSTLLRLAPKQGRGVEGQNRQTTLARTAAFNDFVAKESSASDGSSQQQIGEYGRHAREQCRLCLLVTGIRPKR